jgi:hypothetical protein
VQHPPTSPWHHLHQDPTTRRVYDIPPVIVSSRRPIVHALLSRLARVRTSPVRPRERNLTTRA